MGTRHATGRVDCHAADPACSSAAVGLPDRPFEPTQSCSVFERRGGGIESGDRREQLSAAGGERRIGEVRRSVLANAPHLCERSGTLRGVELFACRGAGRLQLQAPLPRGSESWRLFDSRRERTAWIGELRVTVRAYALSEPDTRARAAAGFPRLVVAGPTACSESGRANACENDGCTETAHGSEHDQPPPGPPPLAAPCGPPLQLWISHG
jgi:hypothetical protein